MRPADIPVCGLETYWYEALRHLSLKHLCAAVLNPPHPPFSEEGC
jgi:hypothetical protein